MRIWLYPPHWSSCSRLSIAATSRKPCALSELPHYAQRAGRAKDLELYWAMAKRFWKIFHTDFSYKMQDVDKYTTLPTVDWVHPFIRSCSKLLQVAS